MEITLVFGENRPTTTETIKTYFLLAQPTGVRTSIISSPFFKVVWSNKKETSVGLLPEREITICYEVKVKVPIIIEMNTIKTNFGKPRETAVVPIEINGEEDQIYIKGFNEFGSFKGSAKIDKKLPKGVTYEVLTSKYKKGTDTLIW